MEPTLILDNDVAAALQEEVARTGRDVQQLANDVLRRSLRRLHRRQPARHFTVHARPLGLQPGLSYHCTSKLLEELEGPAHS